MFLFEYFWTVAGIGGVLTAGFLFRRIATGDPAHLQSVLITALLTAGLAFASHLIVTPKEQIVAICRSLARIADEGDLAALERHLSMAFQAQGLDRTSWLDQVSTVLTRTRLDQVRIRNIIVDWKRPERAEVTFGATCNIRRAEGFGAYLPTRWRLRFSREGTNWRIESIESIPVPPLFLKDPLAD